MKKWLFLLPLFLLADENLISVLKEQEISLQKQQALQEAKKLRDSWINPVNIRYSYQKGDQYPNQKQEIFTISINQPIFKSGGIWEAIQYANSKKTDALLRVKLQKRELVFGVIGALLEYRITDLLIQKQKYLIENAKLDVLIKKENFKSGLLDSTFLDNAILSKHKLELSLIDLEKKRIELFKKIRDISDIEPMNVTLPHFTLLSKGKFLRNNLFLKQKREKIIASKHYRYMTIARYLPTLNLLYSYNYQNLQGSQFFPGFRYKKSYHLYGFSVTMPLFDINSFRNIELSKLEYLKAANTFAQTKREKGSFFEQKIQEVKLLDKKIALTKEDIRLYRSLIEDTKEKVVAGEKTRYDLMILQNSSKVKELEVKIYNLQKQQILSQLYKEVR